MYSFYQFFKRQCLIMAFGLISASLFAQNDAGIKRINSSGVFCSANQTIEAVIQNFGSNQLDSVLVNWRFNGVGQTQFNNQTLIDTARGPLGDTLIVSLGNIMLTGGLDVIEIWTSSPNGQADSDNSNDTLRLNVGTGMSGTYTIGATGNFPDFSMATLNLRERGVCGPVLFSVADGTYRDSITLPEIQGASSTNTITFDGANAANTLLTSSTNRIPTIAFTGGDYITFTNLTISHTGTTDSWGIHFRNGSDHNTIARCNIEMPVTTGFDIIGIVSSNSYFSRFSEGNNANFLTITDNSITGGQIGIHLEGGPVENIHNEVLNNTITLADDYGISCDEQDTIVFEGNNINLVSNFADGFYIFDATVVTFSRNNVNVPDIGMDLNRIREFEISYNTVIGGDDGIDADDANLSFIPSSGSSKVFNNMFSGLTRGGMSWDDSENMDIYHNSVYGNPAAHFNDNKNMNFMNNIMEATGDYALEIDDADAANWNSLDYNIYYNENSALFQFGTTDYNTLSDWSTGVTALPQSNSIQGDPNFFSPIDLHVKAGIANDAGSNIASITDDIDGETRPFAPSTTVDIGADEFLQVNDDAGATALSSIICNTPNDLLITVTNFGNNVLSSVTINWVFDDGTNPPSTGMRNYTGLTVQPGKDTILNTGTLTLLSTAYDATLFTTLPNGNSDGDVNNDTIQINNVPTGMNGSFTIGSMGNYPNLSNASNDLINRGICGPVLFIVQAGNYVDSMRLPVIRGNNASNTITFRGTNRNAVSVVSSTAQIPTIDITGADYVRLSNMTIQHNSSIFSPVIHLNNESDHITIDSCTIIAAGGASGGFGTAGISASTSYFFTGGEGNNANYVTIFDNEINGGNEGIHLEGSTAEENFGNRIINNTIRNVESNAIGVDEQDSLYVIGNTIEGLTSNFSAGMRLDDITDVIISRNEIDALGTAMRINDMNNFELSYNSIIAENAGIEVFDANDANSPSSNSLVYNNMIKSEETGMRWDDSEFINVYHNTVYGNPAIHFSDNTAMNLVNNIMVADDDYALEIDNAVATNWQSLDHNVYHNESNDLLQFGSIDYADLAAWRTGVPLLPQPSSVEGDPNFYSNTDLHIIAGNSSDAGFNLGTILDDIDGEARPFAPATTVDIGADEFLQFATDAGILDNINPPCPGSSDVFVNVVNFGNDTLKSVTLNWIIDDGVSTATTGSRNVTGLNVITGKDTTLLLTNFNFTAPVYDITAYTSLPNGVTDLQAVNDSTVNNALPLAMTGNYTIGASSDFTSLKEAADNMQARGICGPVVFNVQPGTYVDSMSLPEIVGNNATNTITFRGTNSSSVTVTSSSEQIPTIDISGADYVTISNMTISKTATDDAWAIHLRNASDYITIDSCVIEMPVDNSFNIAAIVASDEYDSRFSEANNTNYTTISNNTITGGNVGIHLEGGSTPNIGNRMLNNSIRLCSSYGIYIDEQDSVEIIENTITDLTQTFTSGIFASDINYSTISSNVIEAGFRGMSLIDINEFELSYNQVTSDRVGIDVDDANEGRGLSINSQVYNNMVRGVANAAFSWDDAEHLDIYHNTAYGNPAMHFNDNGGDMRLINNIMVSDGDYALEIDDNNPTAWDSIDYNVFYNDSSTALMQFGTDLTFLSDWQTTVTSHPQNSSIQGDPRFLSNTDLHVRGTIADDAGTILPSITNDIDGESRPIGANVDIGADEFTAAQNDLHSVEIVRSTIDACGDRNQEISVAIENLGTSSQSNVPITLNITGDITATLTGTLTGPISQFETDTVVLSPNIDTYRGGTINFELIHGLAPDDFSFDDTLSGDFKVGGTPEVFEKDTFICNGDSVMLTAEADRKVSIKWFASNDQERDTIPLATDTLSTGVLTSDQTYWAETSDAIPPVKIVEIHKGNPDYIEIQNTGKDSVDLSGWTVAVNRSYSNIDLFASTTATAKLGPGEILVYDDTRGGPNYFGANIFWFPGNAPTYTGWGMLIDSSGTVVDFVQWGWSEDSVYAFNQTINNFNISLTSEEWIGGGIGSEEIYERITKDDNDSTDWVSVANGSRGVTNSGLNLPLSGCVEARTPINVRMTPSPNARFTFTVNGSEVTFNNTTIEDPNYGPYSYSWDFGDGNTSTLENPVHNFADTDNKTVTLTVSNKCEDGTFSQLVSGLGIEQFNSNNIDVYPVPTNGLLNINIPIEAGQVNITMNSVDGKQLFARQLQNQSNANSFGAQIDLSSLSEGIYFLKIQLEDEVVTKRVILTNE